VWHWWQNKKSKTNTKFRANPDGKKYMKNYIFIKLSLLKKKKKSPWGILGEFLGNFGYFGISPSQKNQKQTLK
jgi:hypothetical protein